MIDKTFHEYLKFIGIAGSEDEEHTKDRETLFGCVTFIGCGLAVFAFVVFTLALAIRLAFWGI